MAIVFLISQTMSPSFWSITLLITHIYGGSTIYTSPRTSRITVLHHMTSLGDCYILQSSEHPNNKKKHHSRLICRHSTPEIHIVLVFVFCLHWSNTLFSQLNLAESSRGHVHSISLPNITSIHSILHNQILVVLFLFRSLYPYSRFHKT